MDSKNILENNVIGFAFYLAPLGMALVSPAGTFLEVNFRFCELFNRPREDFIGKSFSDFTFVDDQEESLENLRLLNAGKIDTCRQEKRYLLPNGSMIWFNLHVKALTNSHNEVQYFLSTFEDISLRKAVEEKNYLMQQQYQAVLATSWDGFWIVDLTGRILEVNNAYCQMTGYSREELINMKISDMEANQSADQIDQYMRIVMDKGQLSFETEHFTKQGSRIPIRVNANYCPHIGDKILAFFHDLSEEKEISDALVFSTHQNRKIEKRARSAESALVSVSETTLRDIGCELHDDLGQDLTAGSLIAENIANRLVKEDVNSVQDIRNLSRMLSKCVYKLRRITHGLYPTELEEIGLPRMLRKLVQDWNATGKIDAVYQENVRFYTTDYEQCLQLYRIAQEAGKNVLSHSRARHMLVEFNCNQQQIELKITDDGVGISGAGLKKLESGIGIRTMKARADLIGAVFVMQPNPSVGMHVVVTLNK